MKYLMLVLIVAPILTGCGSLMGPTPAELYAQAQNSCQTYGFKQGTDAFASCMMQMDQAQQANDEHRREAIAESLQAYAAQNRSVTCNSYGTATQFGNTAYGNSSTTCR